MRKCICQLNNRSLVGCVRFWSDSAQISGAPLQRLCKHEYIHVHQLHVNHYKYIYLLAPHIPSKSQLPPANSFILFIISSIMISSGTRPPFSTIAFAFNPTSVPSLICDRRTSPLDKWVTLNVLTIRSETVPLPDPGGPMIRARTGVDDMFVKWIWRICLMGDKAKRIERRRRIECILRLWKVIFIKWGGQTGN